MRVDFRKIGDVAKEFAISDSGVEFGGSFARAKNSDLVKIDAHLQGDFTTPCDICAEDMVISIDTPLELYVQDGIYEEGGSILEDDIIEFYDGYIDFEEILISELEAVKSDYHSCPQCKERE